MADRVNKNSYWRCVMGYGMKRNEDLVNIYQVTKTDWTVFDQDLSLSCTNDYDYLFDKLV